MQRPDEAERITADILKAERANARAAHVHGQALLMQNRAADAIAPLERAARRSGDPSTAGGHLARHFLAWTFFPATKRSRGVPAG
jgi:predicted Zn-dependent protease